MPELARDYWPHFLTFVHLVLGGLTAAHVVMYKRDSRAAVGWVGVIWLSPILGPLLYMMFGVNRIRRKAQKRLAAVSPHIAPSRRTAASAERMKELLGPEAKHLAPLLTLGANLTRRSLLDGNQVEPYYDGASAYRAMITAIDEAQTSIGMCTYIFDNDDAGGMFVEAFGRAVARGVEVRVLVDDVGSRYSFPSIFRHLKQANVPAAHFMRTLAPWRFQYSNLRNHRKIMVVDGKIGFTGGMNIRAGYLIDRTEGPLKSHCIDDLHFRFAGPVVAHLQESFTHDWEFATDEELEGEAWFPEIEAVGESLCRGVPDGPDDNIDRLRMMIMGAIECARHRVYVLTPYFLPDDSLIASLNVAALRGVEVHIVLPGKNNLAMVQWASSAILWQVLRWGCHIWFTPPPFDHGKLVIVDDAWVFLGSANWDPRSMRLNFEFNVEVYDRGLAMELGDFIRTKMAAGRETSLKEMDSRPTLVRLRDGIMRLFSPYL
jgi:cardiolipin synthase